MDRFTTPNHPSTFIVAIFMLMGSITLPPLILLHRYLYKDTQKWQTISQCVPSRLGCMLRTHYGRQSMRSILHKLFI